ncbi:enolase C-terminal domain-like protein [Streptomyces sp. NPDC059092]|uniref:enolase C-terminal domain-like protein n=1 Tax=Streptomyces sp. NPDC059092 TaxID=3346725 RepID=UPI0036B0B8CA
MADRSLLIAHIRITPILIEDAPLLNLQGVHQPWATRAIIEVETAGGIVGVGETYGDAEHLEALSLFGAELAGMSVASPNLLWKVAQRVLRPGAVASSLTDGKPSSWVTGVASLRKLHAICVSAFEVAYLDALGRSLGLPVHELLGGKVRDRVDYAAYLFHKWEKHPVPGAPVDDWGAALDPAGVVAQARRFVDRYGFRSIKLKGGVFEPAQEVSAIRALKEAFPELPVRLDPNGIWSPETSIEVARELSGVVEYLEDPTTGQKNMSAVRKATGIDLATNMCVTTTEEIRSAVEVDAVQVILCDHHFWGGLRATHQLAGVCEALGLGLSMHSNTHLGISLAAMTHAAAAAPGTLHACDTHRPWQPEDVIESPLEFVDGAVVVSDDPGLGVELDRESLMVLHKRWQDSDVRRRDDVGAMRVADPSWVKPEFPRW